MTPIPPTPPIQPIRPPRRHPRLALALPLVLVLAALALPAPRPAAAADSSAPAPAGGVVEAPAAATVMAARDAVYPALVNISVVSERFNDGRAVRYPSAGSGVVVTAEGHVLTNFHVAGQAARVTCTLTDGRVLAARVVAHDPLTDLSVLQLEGIAPGEVPHAALGDSDALEVGDPVIAMGNPLALASSMTLGIVSNPRRVFTDFAGNRLESLELGAGQPTGVFTRWIQHDALILPGNSGGPLVDLDGRVVGINELGGGFGFAIPSNLAAEVLAQAIAGGIRRGWLGFSVLPVTKLGRDRGALVSSVLPGSPAERGDLAAGDLLLAIAGAPVTVRFLEEIPLVYQRVAALPIGEPAALTVERDGARVELAARVAEMPPFRGTEGEIGGLGVTAAEITEPLALVRGLPSAEGLLVTGVRPGHPAEQARPALAPGDVLLAVDGRPVSALAALDEALTAGSGSRLVTFRRRGASLVSVVELEREPRRRWGGELPQPWLGIDTQVVTPELAAALGFPGGRGFRITQVFSGTAAGRSGLAVGDLVTAFDGEPLTASRPQDGEELRREIEMRAIGDLVALTVRRPGEGEREVEIELEPRPEEPGEAERVRQEELGFAVREMAFDDRYRSAHRPLAEGLVVAEVTPGGWAHVAGLEIGDLLLEMDDRTVADVGAFEARMAELVAARPAVIRVFVQRGPRTDFVFIEPDWEGR